jgi:hypothetical protein
VEDARFSEVGMNVKTKNAMQMRCGYGEFCDSDEIGRGANKTKRKKGEYMITVRGFLWEGNEVGDEQGMKKD